MNRNIAISTDVFAAIWAQRQEGEESEDAILRRVFGRTPAAQLPNKDAINQDGKGFVDVRNGVSFPCGFTIYRTYKRKEYSAVADSGIWRRVDTGKEYPSLNQLNASIAAGNENVWNGNWKFQDSDGVKKPIAALRG